MTTQQLSATLDIENGHFRYRTRGQTIYEGKLENLPMPTGPVSSADAIEAMYEDGYVIFRGVLDRQQVADLRAHFDAQGGPDEKFIVPNWCFNKQLNLDFPNDSKLLDYIDSPRIIEVVDAIHNVPDHRARGAVVTGGSMWITGRGRRMPVHVDFQPMTLPESVHSDPETRIPIFSSTAHFYLNDMRADLGPTTVIPGSHKAGRFPEDETAWHGRNPQAVMVNAGDVMLFRSDVWHAAWMNSSEERRYMMQIFYGCAFMAQHFPAMKYDKYWSQTVLDKASTRQRRLLGAVIPNDAK
jgi:ectoine hydroxylase-related dioxygenase (phytanoyl-CoA dioxygenase family)